MQSTGSAEKLLGEKMSKIPRYHQMLSQGGGVEISLISDLSNSDHPPTHPHTSKFGTSNGEFRK